MPQLLYANNSWVSIQYISKWHFRLDNGTLACGLKPKWYDNEYDFKNKIQPKSNQMCNKCLRKQRKKEIINQ